MVEGSNNNEQRGQGWYLPCTHRWCSHRHPDWTRLLRHMFDHGTCILLQRKIKQVRTAMEAPQQEILSTSRPRCRGFKRASSPLLSSCSGNSGRLKLIHLEAWRVRRGHSCTIPCPAVMVFTDDVITVWGQGFTILKKLNWSRELQRIRALLFVSERESRALLVMVAPPSDLCSAHQRLPPFLFQQSCTKKASSTWEITKEVEISCSWFSCIGPYADSMPLCAWAPGLDAEPQHTALVPMLLPSPLVMCSKIIIAMHIPSGVNSSEVPGSTIIASPGRHTSGGPSPPAWRGRWHVETARGRDCEAQQWQRMAGWGSRWQRRGS